MAKITIEFEGDFKVEKHRSDIVLQGGVGNKFTIPYTKSYSYSLTLPHNPDVKIKIKEDTFYKETELSGVTLKMEKQKEVSINKSELEKKSSKVTFKPNKYSINSSHDPFAFSTGLMLGLSLDE